MFIQLKENININNKLTINNSQIRGTNKDYYIKQEKGIKDKGIHKGLFVTEFGDEMSL